MYISKSLLFCKAATYLLFLSLISGCADRPFISATVQMDTEQRFMVRVLLLGNTQSCTIRIDRSFTVSDSQTQASLGHFPNLRSPATVTMSAGRFVIDGKSFASDRITITPDAPHTFNFNGDDFRGKLALVAESGRNSFDAINIVPLEPYLAGVVGAEMPGYWEPAALRAQAIAARTYCLYIKKRFGPNRNWDVNKTVASQVYRGVKAESAKVWQAVNDTAGQILVCGGTEELFPAYYSSACGGHTENSRNVFGDSFPTLRGVPCPYCIDIAKQDRFFWPMVQFDKSDVSEKLLRKYPNLKSLGKIISILSADQSSYGSFARITEVRLIGSTGNSDSVRAEDLRLTIDPTGAKIKSMICQIVNIGDKWAFTNGRGYGHGVGLCQCGAQGMARQGASFSEILAHYYPDSKIVRVY